MKRTIEPTVMRLQNDLPQGPGFYWARWQTPWGVSPQSAKATRWEIVDVFINSAESGDYAIMVLVPGVEEPQKLGDFIWGGGPIPAPA